MTKYDLAESMANRSDENLDMITWSDLFIWRRGSVRYTEDGQTINKSPLIIVFFPGYGQVNSMAVSLGQAGGCEQLISAFDERELWRPLLQPSPEMVVNGARVDRIFYIGL